jgi:phosphatidylethanolamine-binding protein (PEBP) family uncharacterized protein
MRYAHCSRISTVFSLKCYDHKYNLASDTIFYGAKPSKNGSPRTDPPDYPPISNVLTITRNNTARTSSILQHFNSPGQSSQAPRKKHQEKMAATTLIDSLTSASLLPSRIIPQNFTPTYDVSVSFPTKSPSNGSLVRVSEVKETPTISFSPISDSNSAQSFTFFLIDPDAPTPDDPKFAYWRHWVVTNIPSSAKDISEGKTLTQYLAPGPKDESGPHRYLFLLFTEPQGFSIEKADVGGEEFVDRRSFKADEFVSKYGLELVGVQWMRGVGDGWNGGKDEL